MDSQPRSPSPDTDQDMATMVLHNTTQPMQHSHGVNKRYRPAPAKTFQCRGYGDCRMVFSRSEHLARHIRKHTGERPFTCHCGKQFSRLDNLRQHAQTVHADKQDQNERMMRELTSLHASMAAATKSGQPRGKRATQTTASSGGSGSTSGSGSPAVPAPAPSLVKEEDSTTQSTMPMHQRPGTSTGYEGSDPQPGLLYQPAWHVQTSSDLDRPTSRPTHGSNHSFRDHQHPGQSFLAPAPAASNPGSSQSFLSFSSPYGFSLSDNRGDGRPGSSSSRPPTSGGLESSYPRSLPPLASVVPPSIAAPPSQQPQQQQQQQHPSFAPNVLPFLGFRRPSTATRPGTAPASVFGGPGMVHRPELPFLYGRDHLGAAAAAANAHSFSAYDPDGSQSPNAGPSYDSPFSFHPPALSDTHAATGGSLGAFSAYAPGSSPPNARKRPFTGPDGPEPEHAYAYQPQQPQPPPQQYQQYDYGTESRPQSRRLTVMELCNDDAGPAVLPLSGLSSRPGTSSGLVTSASALALIDRSPTLAYAGGVFGRSAAAAGGGGGGDAAAASAAPGGGAGGAEASFGGGVQSSAAAAAVRAAGAGVHAAAAHASSILSPIRGSPDLSDGGYSARSSPLGTRSPPAHHQHAAHAHAHAHASAAAAAASAHVVAAARVQHGSQPSSPAAANAIPRRGGTESEPDQVRIAVSAAHNASAAPVGMRA